MAQSKQQQAILKLGKLLVKELELETSVDTLSRWMAHYIAEKIRSVEMMAENPQKKKAEKECFSLILDLWKHRWHYKPDRQPLRNFNQLFDILERLNPEKETPYYFHKNAPGTKEERNSFTPSDLDDLTSLATQADRAARTWISYVLNQAASKANKGQTAEMIDLASILADSTEAEIVQFVLRLGRGDIDEQRADEIKFQRKSKVKLLQRRISELQKFREFNEYLIGQFEKELGELEKSPGDSS